MDDVKLRDKKWVEFIQHMPDRDAVASQFYQSIGKGSKVKKFKAGQVDLILELDYDEYLKINEHRDEREEEQRQRAQVDEIGHRDGVGQSASASVTPSLSRPSSSSSQSWNDNTAHAAIPAVFPTEHAFPSRNHKETSTSIRDNGSDMQKAAQIAASQRSKKNQKVQGAVRTSFHMCGLMTLTSLFRLVRL